MNKRNIFTFEDHGEVLSFWDNNKVQNASVICFDQHLDYKKISNINIQKLKEYKLNNKNINELNRDLPFREYETYPFGLDNFIFAANELNIIKKFTWVYPENENKYTVSDLGIILLKNLSLVPGEQEEIQSSFKLNKYSAEVTIRNFKIEITTLCFLKHRSIDSDILIDIDLDYFYDPFKDNLHSISDFNEFLQSIKEKIISPITLTYSIKSGFLPRKFRGIAKEISLSLNYPLKPYYEQDELLDSITYISQTLYISKVPLGEVAIEKLWEEHLCNLGPTGLGVKSLFYIRLGDLEKAVNLYTEAKTLGVQYYWSAYKIGIHLMKEKKYKDASYFFEEAHGSLNDSIQVHSLILRSICEFHLGNFQKSLDISLYSTELLSLRPEPYLISALSCKELGMKNDFEVYLDKYDSLSKNIFLSVGP